MKELSTLELARCQKGQLFYSEVSELPLHTTKFRPFLFELVSIEIFMLFLGLSTPYIIRELIIVNLTGNNVLF